MIRPRLVLFYLKEVEEASERCLSKLLFLLPEKEVSSDSSIQQFRVLSGQSNQAKALLTTIPSTEKSLLRLVDPRGTWETQMISK